MNALSKTFTGKLHLGDYRNPSPLGSVLGGRKRLRGLRRVQLGVPQRLERSRERHEREDDGELGGAGSAAGFGQEER